MKKSVSIILVILLHCGLMAQERQENQCENLLERANCIALDLSETIDGEGIALSYRWDMGDGTRLEGVDISHCYAKAGVYTLSLEVWDEAQSLLLENHFRETIYIREPVLAGFSMPERVLANDTFQLKSEIELPEGYVISNIDWTFQKHSFNGNTVALSSPGPGDFPVKMFVTLTSDDSSYTICQEQMLSVEGDNDAKEMLLNRLSDFPDSLPFMEAVSHLLVYDHTASEHKIIPVATLSSELLLQPGRMYTLSVWHKQQLLSPVNVSTKGMEASFETYSALHQGIKALANSKATALGMMTFEEDKADLTRAGKKALKANLKLLENWLSVGLEIGTYTHTEGFVEQNIALSLQRSAALLQRHGLTEKVLVVSPREDDRLVNTCADSPFCNYENEALNKKAIFRLAINIEDE